MPGFSKEWSQRTSGRGRRDALYATLEAAVREDFSCSRNSGGFGDTEFGVAGRSEDASTSEKTYPYPILWYEEMTPSDLDAYHAACSSDQTTPCSPTGGPVAYLKDLKEKCPPQHGNMNNIPQNCGELLRRNLCVFSTGGAITGAAISAEAPIPTAFGPGSDMLPSVHSPSFSETPYPIRHKKGGNVTTLDDSMDPSRESRESEACSRKAVSTWTSQTRSHTPASAREVRTGPICSEPERGIMTLNWRESEAVAAAAGVRKRPRCQGVILQPTSSTVDSSTTSNLSSQGISSRAPSQLRGADDGPDAKGKEGEGGFPSDCRFIRGKEPTSTPTVPSEPSQDTTLATQTLFMPGLPSQVLVTLEGEDTNHIDYKTSQEDEESLGSEHDLSPPSPHIPTPSVSIKRLPNGKAPESHGTCSAVEGARCADMGLDTGFQGTWNSLNKEENNGHNYRRVDNRKERRTQVHEEFIRALEALTIGTKTSNPDVIGKQASEPGYQDRSRFVQVSTEDILPTAWAGRQAEAVDTLERHLLRARDRAPDGYVVRALELASHILSRPRVCVYLGDEEIDHARRMPPQMLGVSGAVFGSHREVVGVAGFVWEILCTEKDGVRGALATADAQTLKKSLGE